MTYYLEIIIKLINFKKSLIKLMMEINDKLTFVDRIMCNLTPDYNSKFSVINKDYAIDFVFRHKI